MSKISVVMAYKDRLQQLDITLRTMSLFPHNDVEVIIVDDEGVPFELSVLQKKYASLNIKVIPMGARSSINPCVVFNRGFQHVTGDIVVLQNPECLYLTDVLGYTRANLTDKNYLTFSCYYMKQDTHVQLARLTSVPDETLLSGLRQVIDIRRKQWYNHRVHRTRCLHFTSAITKKNLDTLGGFDERFAGGYCFDDEEILTRIRLMGLDVEIVPEDVGLVAHQWHKSGSATLSAKHALWQQNKQLYIDLFHREPTCS